MKRRSFVKKINVIRVIIITMKSSSYENYDSNGKENKYTSFSYGIDFSKINEGE